MNVICLSLCLHLSFSATDWPSFRGPFFNGSTDETGLPLRWSDTEGVLWQAKLPGPGACTPCVWGESVFLTAADPDSDQLYVLSIHARNGSVRWKYPVARGTRRTYRSNYASPSATTDGKTVVFFFGNGELLAYDFSGKNLWRRNIQKDYGEFAFLWTFSSSPILYAGRLYLQVLQRDVPVQGRGVTDRPNESYLLAMDPRTGETLWRQSRPSTAVAESREAFTTPVPLQRKDKAQLLVVGSDALTAHDPTTGKELWRWETYNPAKVGHWRLVPSCVAGGGVILVCAPKRAPVYAVKIEGGRKRARQAVAWNSRATPEVTSDVPTPAFYNGDFFILSDLRRCLSRVDPRTGKVKWAVRTPGRAKYEASPLAAGGRLYLINHKGEAAVLDAKDGSVLSFTEHAVQGRYPIRSTIVASGRRLFIRLNRRLLCVGGVSASE